jgi:HEAT repeat protein
MQPVLVTSILVMGTLFLFLLLLLALGGLAHRAREAWYRRRRCVLEPVLVREVVLGGSPADECLRPLLRPGDRPLLLRLLLEQVPLVRGAARAHLGEALESLGFVEGWIEGLRSPRWWRRAEAAEHLGLAGSHGAVEPLVALLEDPVPEVRLRAARALGALGGQAALRPLIDALSRPDRWSALRIADILTSAGREAVSEIVERWEELDVPARRAAVEVLGQVRELSAVPFLLTCLRESEDPDLRARAAHALGLLADPESCEALVGALSDGQWPVRAMAAKALGRLGGPRPVAPLARAVSDGAWWVRANAAEALRALGAEGLNALKAILDSQDRYARHQALMMLQEAGIIDEMAGALASGSEDEREEARRFLSRVLEEGRRDLLRGLASGHPQAAVRREIEKMLLRPLVGWSRA